MNITNRVLTLNQNVANGTVECIAGCRVELNAFEAASLAIPGNPGFTLRCVLEADDPGSSSDEVLFTYPLVIPINALALIGTDHVFRSTVSVDILDEDANGADEIRARFRLSNNSNGQKVTRRSPRVVIVL